MAQRSIPFTSTSGNVQAIQWDDETLDLTVKFRSGTYVASGVSELDALGFEKADSAGQYYNQYIRDNYVVTRV
jgi:hypothetical protein